MTAPALAPDPRRYRSATTLTMRGAPTEGLPAGVVGQVEGIALIYGVVDGHGTTFVKGCLDRTVRERVAAGKVRLFVDHGDIITNGIYDTALHIGVVRAVFDGMTDDGKDCAKFRADIFDTEAGRSAHEYLRAIAATSAETGVSIGMLKEPNVTPTMVGGVRALRIDEVALGEISVTAMSASVPGTRITTVRALADTDESLPEPVGMPMMAKATAALDAAIARHQRHMDGTEPTDAASQEKLMEEMEAARAALTMSPEKEQEQPGETTEPHRGRAVVPDPLLSAPVDYGALLAGIHATVGPTHFRALTRALLGDAPQADSDAATASNAASRDSQPSGTEPLVPMSERLSFTRAHLSRLYP